MLEDKLSNTSTIKIQVNTKFKPQIEDGEDVRTEVIKSFHNAVHYLIERNLIDNEDFEQDIMEIMDHRGELTEGANNFMDLGEISIQIFDEQSLKIKQKNLSDEEIEALKKEAEALKKLPKEQKKLLEEAK